MNTVEKTATGVTPAELILNSSIRLSDRILAPQGSNTPGGQVTLSDTLDNWVARHHTLLTVAQAHQLQSDSHLLVEYDPRITEYPFHSYVLFTPPVGRGNKLLPKHCGQFQVMDKQADYYAYRPFIYDPIRTNPLTVAQHNRNRRSTLQFNVRWSGFDESSDSWELYKALMHVDKLHDYLRANAMKTFIPREHK